MITWEHMYSEDGKFVSLYSLAEFRRVAAKFIKLIIRARWKCDSGFLDSNEVDRWGLNNIENDQLSASAITRLAAIALAELHENFLGVCPSGGIPVTDNKSPEGRLIVNLLTFAPPVGAGSKLNGEALDGIAQELEEGKKIDWPYRFNWSQIQEIRDDLDRLPESGNDGITPVQSGEQDVQGIADDEAGPEPGYLNLIVDNRNCSVRRTGYEPTVVLSKGAIYWPLFLFFYERNDTIRQPRDLNLFWSQELNRGQVCDDSIAKQINRLNRLIKPLGVRVGKLALGWQFNSIDGE